MLEEGDISTLVRLGFTPNQAKVYLALVMDGPATAKEVGNYSEVSREEVYRKLRELQKMGVVEHIIDYPAKFKAIPLQVVFNNMLREKAMEMSKLQTQEEQLLQKVENHTNNRINQETKDLTLIPEGRPLLQKGKEALKKCQHNLDIICSWKKGERWISTYHHLIKEVLNRDVQIRALIKKPEKNSEIPTIIEKVQNKIKIKTAPTLPPTCIALYDKKEVFIATSPTTDLAETPAYWSNNPVIIEMAQTYFDTLWANPKNQTIKTNQ